MQEFLAQVSAAPSLNMLNLAILDATNVMTPVEAMQLHQHCNQPGWRMELNHPKAAGREGEFTAALRYALGKIVELMRGSGKPKLERFNRALPSPGVNFYTDGASSADKSLLICFAGNGGRMMMPLPAFLQHLDARQADVVILADPTKHGFRFGISGIAPTIPEVVEKISQAVPTGYRDAKVMGTSAGGLPALLMAAHSGAKRALAVGAGHPDDERWPNRDGMSLRELLTAAAPKLAGCEVILSYGAESTPDPEAAEELKAMIPNARPLAVSLEGKRAEHSFLADLARAGRLTGFLAESLDFETV